MTKATLFVLCHQMQYQAHGLVINTPTIPCEQIMCKWKSTH